MLARGVGVGVIAEIEKVSKYILDKSITAA
jgi:hypothetical protein